jgi:hypothetical protein
MSSLALGHSCGPFNPRLAVYVNVPKRLFFPLAADGGTRPRREIRSVHDVNIILPSSAVFRLPLSHRPEVTSASYRKGKTNPFATNLFSITCPAYAFPDHGSRRHGGACRPVRVASAIYPSPAKAPLWTPPWGPLRIHLLALFRERSMGAAWKQTFWGFNSTQHVQDHEPAAVQPSSVRSN